MRFLLALILLLPFWVSAQVSFTEFYVQTTGNNLNAGSTSDDSPTYTAASGFWTNATGVWRKDGQDLSGVTNGAWASVYPDATTANPVFIGRVTNVTATNIWISLTAKSGTSPADDTAGATTIRVGGAWAGPNTNQNPSSTHPFGFVTYNMTNSSGNAPCVNFKEGLYSTTNAITAANIGPIIWSGYKTTPRDGLGKATIDGTWSGLIYVLATFSGANQTVQDFVFDHAGTSAASISGGLVTSSEQIYRRVSVRNMARTGINSGAGGIFISCEVYGCNSANVAARYGIESNGSCLFYNTASYSNTTANTSGWALGNLDTLIRCQAYGNGSSGVRATPSTLCSIINSDFYANGAAGIETASVSNNAIVIANCAIFKNASYGISSQTQSSSRNSLILNCSFGQGSETNSSGSFDANTSGIQAALINEGNLLYTVNDNPWTDSVNANFTIKSTALTKSAGYSYFLQSTVNSPTNTVSFPDIGAAQSASTNTSIVGGGTTSHTFAQ